MNNSKYYSNLGYTQVNNFSNYYLIGAMDFIKETESINNIIYLITGIQTLKTITLPLPTY